MAAFCEKYHVTPEFYMKKMTIPQIALMAADSPRIVYKKDKKPEKDRSFDLPDGYTPVDSSSFSTTNTSGFKKITNAQDVLPIINRHKHGKGKK